MIFGMGPTEYKPEAKPSSRQFQTTQSSNNLKNYISFRNWSLELSPFQGVLELFQLSSSFHGYRISQPIILLVQYWLRFWYRISKSKALSVFEKYFYYLPFIPSSLTCTQGILATMVNPLEKKQNKTQVQTQVQIQVKVRGHISQQFIQMLRFVNVLANAEVSKILITQSIMKLFI